MKTIKLEKGSVVTNGVTNEMSSLELINLSLDSPPEKGLTLSDFKKRSRLDEVLKALPEGATELVLEDYDYKTLQQCIQLMAWNSRSSIIFNLLLQFEETI
jgi:hypothetical protein